MNLSITDAPDLTSGRHYVLVTDGSCKGNPGPGGWAVLIQLKNGAEIERQAALVGYAPETTNNRMELTAAIKGLERLSEPDTPVLILTDSQIMLNSMTKWLEGWKRKGWRTSSGPVANPDLLEILDALTSDRLVAWQKVKGHSGHGLNEAVDQLASNAALRRYPKGSRSVKDHHPELFR